MRTHSDIIIGAGGPSAIAKIVPASAGAIKQWRRTDSIPAPYWSAFAEAKIASLDELAKAAARRITVLHDAAPPSDVPTLAAEGAHGAGKNDRNVSRTGAGA